MARNRARRVVLFDVTAKPAILPVMWRLGSAVDGARSYGVRSWAAAYAALRAHRDSHGPIRELQIWSHGYYGRPVISNQSPNLALLRDAAGRSLVSCWFRACDVAKSHDYMRAAVETLGCDVIAHCAVISAPLPWQQRAICALRPGEIPWWASNGHGLQAVSALRMTVPPFAYKPGT